MVDPRTTKTVNELFSEDAIVLALGAFVQNTPVEAQEAVKEALEAAVAAGHDAAREAIELIQIIVAGVVLDAMRDMDVGELEELVGEFGDLFSDIDKGDTEGDNAA